MHRDYKTTFYFSYAMLTNVHTHTHMGVRVWMDALSVKVSCWKTCFVPDKKNKTWGLWCVWRERKKEREKTNLYFKARQNIFLPLSFTYLLIFTFLLSPFHPDPIEVLHTCCVILFSCFVNGTIVGMWHAEGISQCILTVLFSHPVLLYSVSKK